VRPAIEIRFLRHENNVTAKLARLIDHHDVLHAARLRLTRARNDAGAPATGVRDHANRTPPQARVAQLLDGSKIHRNQGKGVQSSLVFSWLQRIG
jgi:hypothetical protein